MIIKIVVEAYRWSPLKSAERGHTKEGRFVYVILMHLKIENLNKNSYISGDLSQHITSWFDLDIFIIT